MKLSRVWRVFGEILVEGCYVANHTGGQQWERMEVLRLYDHHSDEVYRLAYSYLMNRHDAQDIVQEVFLRLLEKNHSIKTESEDAFFSEDNYKLL